MTESSSFWTLVSLPMWRSSRPIGLSRRARASPRGTRHRSRPVPRSIGRHRLLIEGTDNITKSCSGLLRVAGSGRCRSVWDTECYANSIALFERGRVSCVARRRVGMTHHRDPGRFTLPTATCPVGRSRDPLGLCLEQIHPQSLKPRSMRGPIFFCAPGSAGLAAQISSMGTPALRDLATPLTA